MVFMISKMCGHLASERLVGGHLASRSSAGGHLAGDFLGGVGQLTGDFLHVIYLCYYMFIIWPK